MTTDELRAAAETRRELGRDYDEAILLSMADRLARRRRPDLWGDTVTVVIALGSIGLGILVALAATNLGAIGGAPPAGRGRGAVAPAKPAPPPPPRAGPPPQRG